ncbi:hypothetical protein MJO28_004535 [Puccinia striiformis f. sp. tritici]|uniref:Uncharacterized protein n=1 Tax=Puccinia striiformis f. sp. tritici TaxID=168172 RepID=A0ACC0EQG2_9BASI|nr:hypothetical protein MJO28_004535 [Puccinia striiformis f. sp. tritici]
MLIVKRSTNSPPMRSLSSVTPPARNIIPGDGSVLKLSSREQAESQYSAPVIARAYQCYLRLENTLSIQTFVKDSSECAPKISSSLFLYTSHYIPTSYRSSSLFIRPLESSASGERITADHAPTKRRKEAKGWPGPVFANQMGLGWTKLNAVRACTRCRVRHVKCSLIHTGGPCTHCRKRKETCEVLGWKLEPHEASKTIYKYVLPPPPRPLHTPQNSPPEDQNTHSLDPVELCERLEQLSPRRLALLWPWGPDDHEPFYPIGPQFGEDYHEECWAYCPQRQLNELGFRTSSASDSESLSPTYSFEFECPSAPSLSSQPRSNEGYDGQNNPAQQLAERPWFTNHPSPHALVDRPQHTFSKIIQSPHRMSLSFILNSNGARY